MGSHAFFPGLEIPHVSIRLNLVGLGCKKKEQKVPKLENEVKSSGKRFDIPQEKGQNLIACIPRHLEKIGICKGIIHFQKVELMDGQLPKLGSKISPN